MMTRVMRWNEGGACATGLHVGVRAARVGFSGDYANSRQATLSRPDATGEIQAQRRVGILRALIRRGLLERDRGCTLTTGEGWTDPLPFFGVRALTCCPRARTAFPGPDP